MVNLNYTRVGTQPEPVGIQDPFGNQPFVTVFGDLHTSNRQNYITEQFQYGLNTYSLVSSATNGSNSVSGNLLLVQSTGSTTADVSTRTKKSTTL